MAKYTIEINNETADFYFQFADFSDALEDVLSRMLSILKEMMIDYHNRIKKDGIRK